MCWLILEEISEEKGFFSGCLRCGMNAALMIYFSSTGNVGQIFARAMPTYLLLKRKSENLLDALGRVGVECTAA